MLSTLHNILSNCCCCCCCFHCCCGKACTAQNFLYHQLCISTIIVDILAIPTATSSPPQFDCNPRTDFCWRFAFLIIFT